VAEARLPDVLLDLADVYGAAFPRPRGLVIQFTLIDARTTAEKAMAKVQKILDRHGILPSKLIVKPGPEVREPFNRTVTLEIQKDLLM
jgi:hypothetical protein